MDRRNGTDRKARAKPGSRVWLRSYNGGPYSTRRIVRGRTRVNDLCVSVIGGVRAGRPEEAARQYHRRRITAAVHTCHHASKALGFGSSHASEAAAYARVLTDATTLPENLLISRCGREGRVRQPQRLTHISRLMTRWRRVSGFAGKLDKVFAFLCGALLLGDVKGAQPPRRWLSSMDRRHGARTRSSGIS